MCTLAHDPAMQSGTFSNQPLWLLNASLLFTISDRAKKNQRNKEKARERNCCFISPFVKRKKKNTFNCQNTCRESYKRSDFCAKRMAYLPVVFLQSEHKVMHTNAVATTWFQTSDFTSSHRMASRLRHHSSWPSSCCISRHGMFRGQMHIL